MTNLESFPNGLYQWLLTWGCDVASIWETFSFKFFIYVVPPIDSYCVEYVEPHTEIGMGGR